MRATSGLSVEARILQRIRGVKCWNGKMAKLRRGKSQRIQKKPTTAASAALFVRAYVLKLFHRETGRRRTGL